MGEMGNHPCSGRQQAVKSPVKSQSGRQQSQGAAVISSASNPSASGPQVWAVSRQDTDGSEHAERQSQGCPEPARPFTASGTGDTQTNEVTGASVVKGQSTANTVTAGGRDEECLMPGASAEDPQGHPTPAERHSNSDAQINDVLRRLHAAEAKCRELETQNQALEQSLANAVRSQRSSSAMQKQDRPQGDCLERAQSRLSEEGSSQTVEAQNKIIASLQSQLQTAADELKSLREQFNRRLKKQRCASAELRTEAGITIMHLREEKVELCAENEQLKSDLQVLRLRKPSSPCGTHGDDNEEDSGGGGEGYSLLIAELSGQVEHLSSELKKAKRKIKNLQRPAKQPTASAPSLAADWDDDANG